MRSANTLGELLSANPGPIGLDLLKAQNVEIVAKKNPDGITYEIIVRIDNHKTAHIHTCGVIVTDLLGRLGSQEDMGRPGNGRPVRPI